MCPFATPTKKQPGPRNYHNSCYCHLLSSFHDPGSGKLHAAHRQIFPASPGCFDWNPSLWTKLLQSVCTTNYKSVCRPILSCLQETGIIEETLKAEINGSSYQYLVYCRLIKKFIAFFFWIFRSSLYSMCISDHFSQDHCIVMNMCYCNDPNFGEIKRSPESAKLPANTKDSYIAFKYRLGANCSLIVKNSFSTLRSQDPPLRLNCT